MWKLWGLTLMARLFIPLNRLFEGNRTQRSEYRSQERLALSWGEQHSHSSVTVVWEKRMLRKQQSIMVYYDSRYSIVYWSRAGGPTAAGGYHGYHLGAPRNATQEICPSGGHRAFQLSCHPLRDARHRPGFWGAAIALALGLLVCGIYTHTSLVPWHFLIYIVF